MAKVLEGKTIAFLLTDGVEQSELTEPRKATFPPEKVERFGKTDPVLLVAKSLL